MIKEKPAGIFPGGFSFSGVAFWSCFFKPSHCIADKNVICLRQEVNRYGT